MTLNRDTAPSGLGRDRTERLLAVPSFTSTLSTAKSLLPITNIHVPFILLPVTLSLYQKPLYSSSITIQLQLIRFMQMFQKTGFCIQYVHAHAHPCCSH